jgi:hypothetical protein
MITKIKLLTATAVVSLLSACGGGGGGGGSAGPTPIPVVDPKITVYQTFDLSRSVLTGNSASDGVLQGCGNLSNPAATQINLMNFKYDENRNMVRYNFILDGSFNVPNVTRCNTTGITGTITGVTLMVGGNPAYTISSLAIDAGSFKIGQQIFWGNVLKQTGRLINSQVTSATIECTDSAGKGWFTPLTTVGDISNFFAICAK